MPISLGSGLTYIQTLTTLGGGVTQTSPGEIIKLLFGTPDPTR